MVRLLAMHHPLVSSASPHTRELYRWVAARLDRLVYLRVLPIAFALGACGCALLAWFVVWAIGSVPRDRMVWGVPLLATLVVAATTLVRNWSRSQIEAERTELLASLRVHPERRAIVLDILPIIPLTAWALRPLLRDPRAPGEGRGEPS